jgi:hypothetical protein
MASRRPGRTAGETQPTERDRWRRRLLVGQGAYYVITGLWALVHFSSFARVLGLPVDPFRSQTLAAVMVVLGGSLIEAARRGPPGPFPTLLGAAVAGAIAIVSLWWLPRIGIGTALRIDLLLEVAFALALVLLYPRAQEEPSRTATRRR